MKKLFRLSLLTLIALVAIVATTKLVKGDLITSDAGNVAASYADGRVTLAYAEYAAVDFGKGTIQVYDNDKQVATLQLDKTGNEWNSLVYSPSQALKPGTYRIKIPSGAVKGTHVGDEHESHVKAAEAILVVTAQSLKKQIAKQEVADESFDPDAMMAEAIKEIKEQVVADHQNARAAAAQAYADKLAQIDKELQEYGYGDDSYYDDNSYAAAYDDDASVYDDYATGGDDYDVAYDGYEDSSAGFAQSDLDDWADAVESTYNDTAYDGFGFNDEVAYEPFEYTEDIFDIEGYDNYDSYQEGLNGFGEIDDYSFLLSDNQATFADSLDFSDKEVLFAKGDLGSELLEEFELDGRGVTMTTQNFYNETLDFDFPVRYNQYGNGEICWNGETKLVFKAKDKITGLYVGGDYVDNVSADKGSYVEGLWTGELETGDSLVLTAHEIINVESLTVLYNGEDVASLPLKKADDVVINVDITKNDWDKIGTTVGETIGTVSSNIPNFDHYRFTISSEEDSESFISFDDLKTIEGKIVCTSPRNEGYSLNDGTNYTLTINAYDVPTFGAEPVATQTFNFVGSGKPSIDLFGLNSTGSNNAR